MTVLLAVLVVGAGSLAFRLFPLLGAHRIPERFSVLAGWAGLSVITAMTVRTVLHHQDQAVPAATLVAAVSVGLGLLLAFRGRPVLLSVAVGGSAYLVLSAFAAALP